jgi:hypothetical protein
MAFRRMPRQTESQEKGGKGKLTTDPSVHVPVSTQNTGSKAAYRPKGAGDKSMVHDFRFAYYMRG